MADIWKYPPDDSETQLIHEQEPFISTSTPTTTLNDDTANAESSYTTDGETSYKEIDMDLISPMIENENKIENADGEFTHPLPNEVSGIDIDNNSLLNELRAQNDANYLAMNSMVSATITGAIFQLKLN